MMIELCDGKLEREIDDARQSITIGERESERKGWIEKQGRKGAGVYVRQTSDDA